MGTYCRNLPHASQAILNAAVIALVLPMFERTGLFIHSVNAWNGMPLEDQNFAQFKSHFTRFKSHFTRANELRVTELSSADLRFADAKAAIGSTTGTKFMVPSSQQNYPTDRKYSSVLRQCIKSLCL